MSRFHSKAYLWAALAITLMAGPAQAQSGSFEERRQLMRQMTQQLQARLEQRLRCINQAKSSGDLDSCQRTNSTGWHHGPGMGGPGMGGWNCPML
jgi:heme exporter protein D